DATDAAYVSLAHRHPGGAEQLDGGEALARLKPWLEDHARPKILHDAKAAMHLLANHGMALAGVAGDTMLASYVLESHRSHELTALAQRHLDRSITSLESLVGKGAGRIGFDEVD